MQKAYIRELYDIMLHDGRVVSVLSDSGTDYDRLMARELPAQCFDVGIAEQCQVGVAAGMARAGKIPFVCTAGSFLAYRAYEFIRNDVCGQRLNVKLLGVGSGTSQRTLGYSHHTTEDIAALRALPGLTLFSPATPAQAAACIRAAYALDGPCYIRMGLNGEREFFTPGAYAFTPGRADRLCDGKDAEIFSVGSILEEVMAAAALLQRAGIHCGVTDMCSVKPLDAEAVLHAAAQKKALFTVEEHSIYGGLGGAVAEVLAENGCAARLVRIGLCDRFATGYGTQAEVRAQNGLDAAHIAARVAEALQSARR